MPLLRKIKVLFTLRERLLLVRIVDEVISRVEKFLDGELPTEKVSKDRAEEDLRLLRTMREKIMRPKAV
jgi:hypothetical protein